MRLPEAAIENAALSTKFGRPVIKWDIFQVPSNGHARIRFVSKNSSWRQGMWLLCEGGLTIEGHVYKSIELWEDNAPPIIEIGFPANNGNLHVYNIWDKGKGRESQAYTSGMLIETEGNVRKYRCNDIGTDPDFSKLIFELELEVK